MNPRDAINRDETMARHTMVLPRPATRIVFPSEIRSRIDDMGINSSEPMVVNVRSPNYRPERIVPIPTARLVPNMPIVRATPISTQALSSEFEYVPGDINPQTGNRRMVPRMMSNTGLVEILSPLARVETMQEYEARRRRFDTDINQPIDNPIDDFFGLNRHNY